MERKAFSAKVKATDTPGEFEALVAVFGNVDLVGDRIEKGAFKRTLAEKGLPPIVWSHMWNVPPIGQPLDAKETDAGLEVKARLFVGEGEDHELARQVYAGMKAGVIREFSFSYDVREASTETEDGVEVRVLKDLDLFEVGPCLVGANPATELLTAPKALELFTGLPVAASTNSGANVRITSGSHVKVTPTPPPQPVPPAPPNPPEPARVFELLTRRAHETPTRR